MIPLTPLLYRPLLHLATTVSTRFSTAVAAADAAAHTKARDVGDTGAVAEVAHEAAAVNSAVAEVVAVESSGAPEAGSAALLAVSLLKDTASIFFSRQLGHLGKMRFLRFLYGVVIYLPDFSLSLII
jgi:hypothetical protein